MIRYEMMIRLKVYARLKTRSKLFCGCSASMAAPANSHCCPICLGLPGSLPVLNGRALELAAITALTLNCSIDRHLHFDRKHCIDPAIPKGYQICQHGCPLGTNGYFKLKLSRGEKPVKIARVHLEEAAAQPVYDHALITNSGYTGGVDYNRAGIPLVKIVSGPDLSSPHEARRYLEELRLLLIYAGVSDCIAEEDGLLFDIDMALKSPGDERRGMAVKIKNMKSIDNVEKALAYEAKRQARAGVGGEEAREETRYWGEVARKTYPLKDMEDASDYLYFPEPDLPPVNLKEGWIKRVKEMVPELPDARRERLRTQYSLNKNEVEILIADPGLSDYFEQKARQEKDFRKLARRICGDVSHMLKKEGRTTPEMDSSALTETPHRVNKEKINRASVQKILAETRPNNERPAKLVNPQEHESIEKK